MRKTLIAGFMVISVSVKAEVLCEGNACDMDFGIQIPGKSVSLDRDIEVPKGEDKKKSYSKKSSVNAQKSPKKPYKKGNLPPYFARTNASHFIQNRFNSKTDNDEVKNISLSDELIILISDDVKAPTNFKSPLKAKVLGPKLNDAILLGYAQYDEVNEWVNIEFTSITVKNKSYLIKAQARDYDGTIGLKGLYEGGEKATWLASIGLTFSSIFVDSTVNRPINSDGNQINDTSLENASKKALAQTIANQAQKYSEKAENKKGYSILKGPTLAKVLMEIVPKKIK